MGLDLTKHRPVMERLRPVEAVDLSGFAGYQARVRDLPALMARPGRDHYRALVQFIKDWNYWVADRDEMLDGSPPPGGDPFHLACIAAVVHALTVRDGVEVPDWVHLYRAACEQTISGIPVTTDFGRLVAAEAPATCAHHGVYFEADLLRRGIPAAS